MKKIKCPQMRCSYNHMGGCQNCKICDCPPNEINDNCDRCYNCSMDEGILRWDSENVNNEQDEKVEVKPMEIKTR